MIMRLGAPCLSVIVCCTARTLPDKLAVVPKCRSAPLLGSCSVSLLTYTPHAPQADFKAEKISAETVVLGEDGKPMPLPPKKH